MSVTDSYPLQWPAGFPRRQGPPLSGGNLAKRSLSKGGAMTHSRILDDLEEEVRRLGGRNLIVSSNLRMRLDGRPVARQVAPDDSAVALYFDWNGKQHAMACDLYGDAWKNLRALTLCIDSLRTLERHGGGAILERAFQGFAALPASIVPARRWRDVLDLDADAAPTANEILLRFRRLSLERHPDKPGGSEEAWTELVRARDQALAVVPGGS